MQAIVHDEAHCIFTLPDVLTADECRSLVVQTERAGFADAPVTTGRGFVMMPGLRNNTRVMVDDVARAAWLWQRVAAHVPARRGAATAVGLNERLRYYRYEPGQRFAWHRDGAFVRSTRERSELTLLVYLNDDFTGGETAFEDGPAVHPRRGMALFFAHPVRHQGTTVTSGRKYVLRSDVMYAREDG